MGKTQALLGTIGIALLLAVSAIAGAAASAVGPTTIAPFGSVSVPPAGPIAAPLVVEVLAIELLPSTSTLDRSGPLPLLGLPLAVLGALLFIRSRRSARQR